MKTDPALGKKVHDHLVSIGMETPMTPIVLPREVQQAQIEASIEEIMRTLHLDLSDDSLIDTPKRVAKMYLNEFYRGLDYNNFPKCTTIDNKMQYNGMLVEQNIKVMSNCEHHLVTIDGVASVAYIPKNKVIGLSKLNRIVDFFARRPQVQERLTNQIWHTLSHLLETEDVAVYIDAVHYCVRSRGVEDANSSTVTSKLGGSFWTEAATRAEFMSIARGMK